MRSPVERREDPTAARGDGGRWVFAIIFLTASGCSAVWPTMVRTAPEEPLFHSGFPLVGAARTDAAVCSLATVGPEATALVSPPERIDGAIPLEVACAAPIQALDPGPTRGSVGRLLAVTIDGGAVVHGYLFSAGPRPTGLAVAFSGLGMPPAGWVNQRFAEVAARRRIATFAPVRDEAARPISFDPVREARRALDAAVRIRDTCGFGAETRLGFLGISMGGLEALLANREALRRGAPAHAAVLDPLLDPDLVTENLDSTWHSFAVDAMQAYFRRILTGRYGEPSPPSFRKVMARVGSRPGSATDLRLDAPNVWLCKARRDAYAVFLSDTDPVLGDAQREFASACGFPIRPAGAPGHTPLACRPALFEELVEAAFPPTPGTAGTKLGATWGRRAAP